MKNKIRPVRVMASAYVMEATDYYLAWNAASDGTVTLPSYRTAISPATTIKGRVYIIKNTSASSLLTIAGSGNEALDDQSDEPVPCISLPAGSFCVIVNTGGLSIAWEVIFVGHFSKPESSISQTVTTNFEMVKISN